MIDLIRSVSYAVGQGHISQNSRKIVQLNFQNSFARCPRITSDNLNMVCGFVLEKKRFGSPHPSFWLQTTFTVNGNPYYRPTESMSIFSDRHGSSCRNAPEWRRNLKLDSFVMLADRSTRSFDFIENCSRTLEKIESKDHHFDLEFENAGPNASATYIKSTKSDSVVEPLFRTRIGNRHGSQKLAEGLSSEFVCVFFYYQVT